MPGPALAVPCTDIGTSARGKFTRLGDRHDRRVRRPGNVKRGEPERIAGIVRDQHLNEVLVRIAEVQEGNVESPRYLIHHGVRERETVLGKRGVRVAGWHVNSPGAPGRASIGGTAEPQLAGGRLKAGPGHIHIVLVLVDGIGTHGKPVFVAVIVLLHNYARAPRDSAVGGFVYLNRAVHCIGSEIRKVEDAVPVDANRRVAKRSTCIVRGRQKTIHPAVPAIVRRCEARRLEAIGNKPRSGRIMDDMIAR